ncbi:FmdB family zinc ribbon protein [Stieleria varia]|uniref:Zinc ribbon domain protein n=1 Tax=Stieleria varia TaxID=2528005 RepID=A0A5C6A189_9BACT|nr:zinc ribbon domain-containing protein [Stieleria varia]TWT93186.1 Zinc ribbon domain protein [Stieleria varia]
MPIYEYECDACKDVAEVLVRRPEDTQAVRCPQCDSDQMHRVMSATAAPNMNAGGSLPVAARGGDCGAPRCCGGGCQI